MQRWLSFVKYLREFGIEPIVYIPENPRYPIQDAGLQKEVPDDLLILKQKVNEPYKLAGLLSKKKTKQISRGIITEKQPSPIEKLLLYIRGNFFIPDARVGWVKPSVAYLNDYLKEHAIDVVITTGPPHSLHLIGLELQRLQQIKWIADFRDPWTTIHYHKSLRLSNKSELKHRNLETKVLKNADHIIVTSRGTAKEFSEKTKKPITVITNGYEKFETKQLPVDSKFTIAHIGSLLSERNPELLWKVLSELVSEDEDFGKNLQIILAGAVSGDVLSSISNYKLDTYLENRGYVSHNEARKLQQAAQLLLLIEMDRKETKAIIPGKLFEYLAAERPILALGPKGSDIEPILAESKSGCFFNYSEEKELKVQLMNYFKSYQDGNLKINPVDIDQYSRRSLTEKLSMLIKAL